MMSSVCDVIGNKIPTNVSKWSFEVKLYRENPHGMGPIDHQQQQSGKVQPNFLYTVTYSNNPKEIVCLVKGVGTLLRGSFDAMLATKLQSLWQLRQTMRGEGTAFEIKGGEYCIRVANMMLQGSFRGLLIEVEYNDRASFWSPSLSLKPGSKTKNSKVEQNIIPENPQDRLDLSKSESFKEIDKVVKDITNGMIQQTDIRLLPGPPKVIQQTEPFTRVETAWQYVEVLAGR